MRRVGRGRRLHAGGEHALLDIGPRQRKLNFPVQLGDDLARRAGGCEKPAPAGHVKCRIAGFDHGRQVGQEQRALRHTHGEPGRETRRGTRQRPGAYQRANNDADRQHHSQSSQRILHRAPGSSCSLAVLFCGSWCMIGAGNGLQCSAARSAATKVQEGARRISMQGGDALTSEPRPIRRVVTGNDEYGRSGVLFDSAAPNAIRARSAAALA
jgi:hypothetical protein